VKVVATGGTIANTPSGRLNAAEVAEAIPQLQKVARLEVEEVIRVGSSSITLANWLDPRPPHQRHPGARSEVKGVVVTHGSNTVEETAYFLSLTVKSDKPVVLTAAQRQFTTLSSDSPKNFLQAVRVAASDEARGKGVLVVLKRHDPRRARRDPRRSATGSRPTTAATSVRSAWSTRDKVSFYRAPTRRGPAFDLPQKLPRVTSSTRMADADGALIDASKAEGLVIAGFPTGSGTPAMDEAVKRVRREGRAGGHDAIAAARAASPTRGRPRKRPVLWGDNLTPQKARILLMLALTRTRDRADSRRSSTPTEPGRACERPVQALLRAARGPRRGPLLSRAVSSSTRLPSAGRTPGTWSRSRRSTSRRHVVLTQMFLVPDEPPLEGLSRSSASTTAPPRDAELLSRHAAQPVHALLLQELVAARLVLLHAGDDRPAGAERVRPVQAARTVLQVRPAQPVRAVLLRHGGSGRRGPDRRHRLPRLDGGRLPADDRPRLVDPEARAGARPGGAQPGDRAVRAGAGRLSRRVPLPGDSPVPLSLPYIGVYHAVERTKDEYRLSHERPAWRVWHNGDQDFLAQPGDRVFVFFRVFSPTRFADEVRMRWFLRQEHGWVLQDTVPIKIVGGRAEGFRGYGFKSKYQPGEWKVQIETPTSARSAASTSRLRPRRPHRAASRSTSSRNFRRRGGGARLCLSFGQHVPILGFRQAFLEVARGRGRMRLVLAGNDDRRDVELHQFLRLRSRRGVPVEQVAPHLVD
jgi:L-asparaginase